MDAYQSGHQRRLPFLLSLSTLLCLIVVAGCSRSGSASPWGMRTTELRPVTGRIITAEEIARYPSSASVEDILATHFSGLNVRRRHEPGGTATVQILGLGVPLFVIDGVPQFRDTGNLGLNPRDIESIEIRKHGGGTAEFGLRGSNGVILIRTKVSNR